MCNNSDSVVKTKLTNKQTKLSKVSKRAWCLTSTDTIRLIRDGGRWRKREITYLSLHCHYQNDSCIKMGSDERHCKSLINCEGQTQKTVSTDHNFRRERAKAHSKRGPSAYQPNALPLGQTGSQTKAKTATINNKNKQKKGWGRRQNEEREREGGGEKKRGGGGGVETQPLKSVSLLFIHFAHQVKVQGRFTGRFLQHSGTGGNAFWPRSNSRLS